MSAAQSASSLRPDQLQVVLKLEREAHVVGHDACVVVPMIARLIGSPVQMLPNKVFEATEFAAILLKPFLIARCGSG